MGPLEGPSHLSLRTGILKAFDSSALLNSPVLPDETTVLLPNSTPLWQWPVLTTLLDMAPGIQQHRVKMTSVSWCLSFPQAQPLPLPS